MKEKKQSILDTVREINNKEALEKQERFEKQNNKFREKYGQELENEKKEILKVKQGISENSELFAEDSVAREYTFADTFKNFIYHNKWWLGIAAFIVFIAAFLTYDTLTTVRADVRIMLLTDDDDLQFSTQKIHEYFNGHVIDYNDDDRQYTDIT